MIFLYWITRLINLTILPIFTDEAIYIRWGQIVLGDPVWKFISLTDGKQPLFIWLMAPLLKVITDPLVAGRLVSIISGFFGLLGMGFFGLAGIKKSTRSIYFRVTLLNFAVFSDV